jgi:succinate dehydrogenase/fumarate reductase flavoprotein subunit
MREKAGTARDEQRLSDALSAIDRLEAEAREGLNISALGRYNTEVFDALEVKSMLVCARMIALSARLRKESRGAHLRLDYPDKDEVNWRKNIVLWKEDGQIRTAVYGTIPIGKGADVQN